MRRQDTEWERVFVKYTIDKGFITEIYNYCKLIKGRNPNRKMGPSQKVISKWPMERNGTIYSRGSWKSGQWILKCEE